MGIECLVSLCNTTGFSSTQTTGSRSDSGFSYILSTSSILKMYSSFNSPTRHIFFPPWPEVMAFQQNSNGLSAHAGNKFALDNFFGQQPHRPARPPLWRRRTDHGDNALLLLLIQTGSLARAGCIKQCALQAAIDVPSSDLPHGLGRKPQVDRAWTAPDPFDARLMRARLCALLATRPPITSLPAADLVASAQSQVACLCSYLSNTA